jgi:Rrf2 family protein
MVSLGRSYGRATLTTDKLSESENVPADYVNQLLLKVKRAGLVESHRGSGGGYRLSRAPAEITLGQIVRAVQGEIFEGVCDKYEGGEKDCHHQGHCSITPVWQRLGRLIEDYFDGITLEKLLAEQGGACGRVAAVFDKIEGGN